MSFGNYKTILAVLKSFQMTYTEANFIGEAELNIPNYFREDLETVMREEVFYSSEFAICEIMIYPILKEVWKLYNSKFIIWSHH